MVKSVYCWCTDTFNSCCIYTGASSSQAKHGTNSPHCHNKRRPTSAVSASRISALMTYTERHGNVCCRGSSASDSRTTL